MNDSSSTDKSEISATYDQNALNNSLEVYGQDDLKE